MAEDLDLQKKINTVLQKYTKAQNLYMSVMYLCHDIHR